MQKSQEIAWKMTFSDLQNTNTRPFSRYLLEILYSYTPDRVLSHIFRFLEFEKNLSSVNNLFCWLFFNIFKNCIILKIWDGSLIETFILYLLFKTNRFYFLNYLRDSFSRKPLFLPKYGKTWRHFDVIYGRRIQPSEFYFCQDVSNW